MKRKILLFLFFSAMNVIPLFSEENLLQRVKNNPNEAIKLCKKFRNFNAKGISVNGEVAIREVVKEEGFDQINAEIYSVYAIGLHCPEVF